MSTWTSEQQAIINHPVGQHARVLAVAGSGKTSTMVARIKHLVLGKDVDSLGIEDDTLDGWANVNLDEELDVRAVYDRLMTDRRINFPELDS